MTNTVFISWFLLQLYDEAAHVASLLETAISANPKAVRRYIPTLLPTLLSLLQSPLTAPLAMPVFLKLGKSALDGEHRSLGRYTAVRSLCSIFYVLNRTYVVFI